MPGAPQSDDQGSDSPPLSVHPGAIPAPRSHSDPAGDPPGRGNLAANLSANLEERELESALQLLVERAQYITGATGAALALPQGDEMVCRASAGACAPTVGARLQVRSGLTGESIARRQILRCDNAETDARVNLETCRALGIASIVVLPLLRRTGEVRGLFELFSDHPYAFEERDLVALERMAALTITALDLAEQRHDSVTFASTKPIRPPEPRPSEPRTVPAASPAPQAKEIPRPQSSSPQPSPRADERLASASPESGAPDNPAPPISAPVISPPVISASFVSTPVAATPVVPAIALSAPITVAPVISPSSPTVAQPTVPPPVVYQPIVSEPTTESEPPTESDTPQPVPEAMRRVQKCTACGFPVSEGRTFCLDCENLERLKIESDKKARQKAATEFRPIDQVNLSASPTNAKPASQEILEPTTEAAQTSNPIEANPLETDANGNPSAELLSAQSPEENLPPFLTNPQLVEESWLAKHVNLLAFLVLAAAFLVAAVVFFR